MQYKQLTGDMSVSAGDRAFTATITTNAVDRDREVLLPEGMDATDFEKNPVIFWAHDYFSPPLGKATALKRHKDRWTARGVMASRPDTHPEAAEWFPDTVLSLMAEGIIKGVSVGFDPTSSRKATPEDKATFGEPAENVVARWKLLEFSIAPIPANQDALIEAVGKGLVRPETACAVWGVRAKAAPTRPVLLFLPTLKPRRKKARILQSDVNRAVTVAIARRQGKIYL